jgi:hypothetical protein
MNILTDILSLIKQNKYASSATDNDVIAIGVHEEPPMLGIASPIPYKSVKVIKLKDLQIPAQICTYVNVPTSILGNTAGVYKDTVTTTNPQTCTVNLRKLKSLSVNTTIQENGDYIDITTTGEPNKAENLSTTTGLGVFAQKNGEMLQFKSIKATSSGGVFAANTELIDFKYATEVRLASPNGKIWKIKVSNTGVLSTEEVT